MEVDVINLFRIIIRAEPNLKECFGVEDLLKVGSQYHNHRYMHVRKIVNIAQHSTAQHSTAQHSTAQHSIVLPSIA